MSPYSALIHGILEGLTEFIPVSSTGHLVLLSGLTGENAEQHASFDIFIQLGAILAVVVLYWRRFLAVLQWKPSGGVAHPLAGPHGILCFAVACLPVFVLGFLFHGYIKEHLFNSYTVAYALILGGVVMIVVERLQLRAKSGLEGLTVKSCLIVGLVQCFSLWPGVSRSASTIIGGLFCGLDRRAAAEFSFLIAVPVMVVAVGYDFLKIAHTLTMNDLAIFAFGFFVAFITALFAIRFFLRMLERFTLLPFGVYRIVLGIGVLVFLG